MHARNYSADRRHMGLDSATSLVTGFSVSGGSHVFVWTYPPKPVGGPMSVKTEIACDRRVTRTLQIELGSGFAPPRAKWKAPPPDKKVYLQSTADVPARLSAP